MTTVTVRVNGALANAMGTSRVAMTLPEEATLAELIAELGALYPACDELIGRAVPVAGGRHLSVTTPLSPGQEVALLMPIAGGA